MVSNVLELEPDELARQLTELREQHASDPAYQRLRNDLPAGWPV